ncbi:MAG TPA: proton-conducting transporter membrane subunit, partial [Actinomycetota bacterium]|nr:proton-conducting transporter membrane subunit [Actinomycetota bacterium]
VAVIGVATALYAAILAMAEDDIKRVLAYSTISQLGFMFLAAGVGAYAIAIFHLVTHAFFKALMFLGAGSVMHATDGEIDITKLGGLRRPMPVTATLFVIGGLALAGIPLFAGFFSKDQILSSAYEAGENGLWIAALVASGFTALYVTRAILLTFFGRPQEERHPHESPALMTVPMGLLAVGALAGGLLGLSAATGRVQAFLAPLFGGEAEHPPGGLSEGALVTIAIGVALAGITVGWAVYGGRVLDWVGLRIRLGWLHRTLARGWYVDDVYGALLVLPGKAASAFLAYVFDQRFIDGAVNGLGNTVGRLAGTGRRVQSGLVRTYALGFLLGAVALLVFVLARS